MKIVVVEPLGTGGMIHYAYQLCQALASQGAEVCLLTSTDYELPHLPHQFAVRPILQLWPNCDPEASDLALSGLGPRLVYQLRRSLRRVQRAAILVREWNRITRFVCREQPDIVQLGLIRFVFQSIFLMRMRAAGLMLTQICHEFENRELRWRWLHRIARDCLVWRHFSTIIFPSEYARRKFLKISHYPRERTYQIPHGNEQVFGESTVGPETLRERYGLAETTPVILFFGRLIRSKGIPDLLKAFAIVHQSHPDVRLLIVGFPSKWISVPRLNQLVQELGIEDAVVLDPRYVPMEEVGSLMALARVVALPYHSATQSGALQVAYAFGRPVVATRVGAFTENVDDGESGRLVAPRDPVALAAALAEFIRNPDLAEVMGRHALHLSQTRYAWDPIAAKLIGIFEHQLSKRKPKGGKRALGAAAQ